MTPFPSFPQIQSADLGEGEWRVWMKREKINSDYEQRRIVAYLDSFSPGRDLRQARAASLRKLQAETQEELDALLPSVLDKAFKGEL